MSYQNWWRNIGSGIIPHDGDDIESHVNMVSEAAWDAATTGFFENIGIDPAKPGSERCLRVWMDDDEVLKVEEIPMSRVCKEVEA